jgi:hypothetical protein
MWPSLKRCFFVLVSVTLLVVACNRPTPTPRAGAVQASPTLRLYLLSDVAGALEPCGCRKDMLGGIDHAAAMIRAQKSDVPHSLLLASGPLFFMDPQAEKKDAETDQDLWKAESIAESFQQIGLKAWAPGANDWAMGAKEFRALTALSGAVPLGANLSGDGLQPFVVEVAGKTRVGLAGISVPELDGKLPQGVAARTTPTTTTKPTATTKPTSKPEEQALRAALATLRKQKAQIRVALISAPRRTAMRLAERVPGFHVVLVGSAVSRGDLNRGAAPPVMVGESLVVAAPNHLQGLALVDFFIRDDGDVFVDASGIQRRAALETQERRVAELEKRMVQWKRPGSGVSASDLAARENDLAALRKEIVQLKQTPPAPAGSFFRYRVENVTESAGVDETIKKQIDAFYKRVNEHNRVAFADRLPPEAGAGEATYVGIAECAKCHEPPVEFWKTTRHSGAYATLADDHKQFNLDCVSCHVTGYEKPGGSTVTHVSGLENVQCEVCHGPGSKHVAKADDPTLIKRSPDRSLCATQCHHPPHVADDWNVNTAWAHIVGPGHGM